MAVSESQAFTEYWAGRWTALEFILKCAGYRFESTGIEHGYAKRDHAYWFCDDGNIELHTLDKISKV